MSGACPNKMFSAETKAFVKNVGAQGNLIPNDDLNKKFDLLTLVKVKEGSFWKLPKYKTMMCTLPELMEEEFSPDFKEEVLVKDFVTSVETSGSGSVGGGQQLVGEAQISASSDTVDGLAQPVSIKKKTAVITNLRNRVFNKAKVAELGLKENDKLTFVHQTVYNTGPVKVIRKAKRDGSILASCQKTMSLLVKGSRKEETSFTVLEESMFAYGLVEIKFKNEKLGLLSCDSSDSEVLPQVREEIQMKEGLLRPLVELAESSRRDLLNKLREVVEDGEALTLLEEMLHQPNTGASARPPPAAVSSFLDLLDVSGVSSAARDAVHLLVSAMDNLPEGMPPLLTSCDPETMRVLRQLVDALQQDGRATLPESPPAPLQEDGGLGGVADLLCSTEQTLAELSEAWNRPAPVLLEVLALSVLGLSLMQPRA
ncbi:gasdermin-E-like [Odontesthes bonariensis]